MNSKQNRKKENKMKDMRIQESPRRANTASKWGDGSAEWGLDQHEQAEMSIAEQLANSNVDERILNNPLLRDSLDAIESIEPSDDGTGLKIVGKYEYKPQNGELDIASGVRTNMSFKITPDGGLHVATETRSITGHATPSNKMANAVTFPRSFAIESSQIQFGANGTINSESRQAQEAKLTDGQDVISSSDLHFADKVNQVYDPGRYSWMFNNVERSPKVREEIERTHIPNKVLVTRYDGDTGRKEQAVVEVDARDGDKSFDYTRRYVVSHANFNDASHGGELKAEDIG